ncbi:MAG: NADH-quinone oxidoreductase subunit C [Deltaproteobacteria bacterium]|nr:NADH-quinone oxidoreductase subunit C [Deltaproteobacteria bacterium]
MSQEVLQKLQQHLGENVLEVHDHRGDETATIEAKTLHDTCRWLKKTAGLEFDMLVDLTVVDYLEQGRTPRFEVVYHLYSIAQKHRLRLKVGIETDTPEVDTVSDLWRNANWCEREAWDLYGISFRNHPELRRILLYEEFEGHPLRKDYPKAKRQPLVRRPREEFEAVVRGSGIGNKRTLI